MRVETVLRLALGAGPALPADGAPIEDDTVARCHLRDVGAHGADHSGGLVAEQIGELITDPALLVVQVRVADTAGENVHQSLPRPRIRHQDGLQRNRGVFLPGNDCLNFMDHYFRVPLDGDQ